MVKTVSSERRPNWGALFLCALGFPLHLAQAHATKAFEVDSATAGQRDVVYQLIAAKGFEGRYLAPNARGRGAEGSCG